MGESESTNDILNHGVPMEQDPQVSRFNCPSSFFIANNFITSLQILAEPDEPMDPQEDELVEYVRNTFSYLVSTFTLVYAGKNGRRADETNG